MVEHRSCPRWKINAQAKVQIGDSLNELPATIIDINFKGARVLLHQRLTPDISLKLYLIFSEDVSLDLEVWIAWHRNFEGQHIYGLYFSKISEEDKETMHHFLHTHFAGQMSRHIWGDIESRKEGDMEDRRIFERFTARFPVNLLCDGEMRERKATTSDVSAKGIGFVTDRPLTPLTPLEMWLTLPDSPEPLYTRGTVVWSKMLAGERCAAGVELEKADLMGVSRILRMI